MKSELGLFVKRRERGQTIIVALIILGLLMIIGFVYIGIVNRNILTSGRMQRRSISNDLSEAGIRYAHAQLLNSALGADWRGTPTGPVDPTNSGLTLDPDALYLRPGSGYPFRPGSAAADLGGPDGLGQFFRVNFNNGRALVRVRYAPSDINIFSPTPTGAMRSPGQVRNYLIIESVGRSGRVDPTDPTTLVAATPLRYAGFGNPTQFQDAISNMLRNEKNFGSRSINRAFASIGIIETARFVTNKYKVSRPVELGISEMLGATYNDFNVATAGAVPLALQLGGFLPLYTISQNPTITPGTFPGFGSIHVNGDVLVHGSIIANMNRSLGDRLTVSGSIRPASDTNGSITFNSTEWNGSAWNVNSFTVGGAAIDSRQNFSTQGGLIVDGRAGTGTDGYPRGVGTKVPPSMLTKDPNTGENRYVGMTRDSGVQLGQANSGSFGHGEGVYVNNSTDRQMAQDELGRQAAGTGASLVYDWLNPNNGQTGTGWRGFLYVPPAAYVRLLSDGFEITRNGGAPAEERTWRYPNGADAGSSIIRYRIGIGTDNRIHIVNTNTAPTPWSINANLGALDYQRGPIFNGVVYFEGNVRVRGIIPTDVQMTLVSNASIYIEGSITKGVLANGLQQGIPRGDRLPRLSTSMLMLMARDYVALNSTQFFGAGPNQQTNTVSDIADIKGFTPFRLGVGETFTVQSEFVLDPNAAGANPLDPRTWPSFASTYTENGAPANKIGSNLLLTHTMDNGPGSSTFVRMDVNAGLLPQPRYYFPKSATNLANNATPAINGATTPIYGMGGEPYQIYGKFESIFFPLIDPNAVNTSDRRYLTSTAASGVYSLFAEGTNEFTLQQTNFGGEATNDYLIGKTALIPHDIRIEATIFAEEGSFFVIPGQWFNPNPNDLRETYNLDPGTTAEKNQHRLEAYGSTPGMPFFGEPPDVRITIVGAVSENMPPTIDQQSQWVKKWGWIPRDIGASGLRIPAQHVPNGYDLNTNQWVPNLSIVYDPVLATARVNGFNNDPNANPIIRQDAFGRALPPLPRLPVGPALAFFGEVR
ncbi:MAG: hypothetical protein ACAH95_17450 [Fimbriimonas sp.]